MMAITNPTPKYAFLERLNIDFRTQIRMKQPDLAVATFVAIELARWAPEENFLASVWFAIFVAGPKPGTPRETAAQLRLIGQRALDWNSGS